MRESPFGGWGKEFMLTTLRMVLLLGVLGVGSAVVGGAVGGGGWALDGARIPLLGEPGVLLRPERFPMLFRVLGIGSAGRAACGGPMEERAGRGVVAIVTQNC